MSQSAFGVEHTKISKRNKDDAKNSALTAGGGVVAATGLLGGGIPGVHSKHEMLAGAMDKDAPWQRRAGSALASMRGGVFGYRTDAHQKTLKEKVDNWNHFKNKPANRKEMYLRGRDKGKIEPERQVIRHLKRGRKLSNALLIGGGAAAVHGVNKMREKNPVPKNLRYEFGKAEKSDRFYGALAGGGGAAAGASMIAEGVMRGQQKRWTRKKDAALGEAEKITPRVKTTTPSPDIENDANKFFAGKSKKDAFETGVQRGHATQHKYFAHTYGKNAKYARMVRNPALIVGGVGGTGLFLSREKKKGNLRLPKRMSQ